MFRTFVHRGARGAALAAAATLLVIAVPAPAHATVGETHCISLIDDGTVVCAATPQEADAAFTEATGYVRVESGAEVRAARGAGLLVVYSLATFYQNSNYGGSSATITRSFDCDGATATGFSNLSTVGLDNAVSSLITYRSCQARLYDGASYTGGTYGYTTTQASLPFFNDLASSARAR